MNKHFFADNIPKFSSVNMNLILIVVVIVSFLLRIIPIVVMSTEQINDFQINKVAAIEFAYTGDVPSLPSNYYIGPVLVGGYALRIIGSIKAYYYIQALIGTLTVFYFYFLAKLLFHRRKVALICAGLLAVYPDHILYTAIFGYEIFFLFIACVVVHLTLSKVTTVHPWITGAAMGYLVAFSLLFRTYLLLFIPLLIIISLVLRITNSIRKLEIKYPSVLRWRYLIPATCSFIIMFSSIGHLKDCIMDHRTKQSSLCAFLWWGNNPVTGGERPPSEDMEILESEFSSIQINLNSEQDYMKSIFAFATSRPYEFFGLQIQKLQKLIRLKPDGFPIRQLVTNLGTNGMGLTLISMAFFTIVYLLGMAGLCSNAKLCSWNFGYWLLGFVIVFLNVAGVASPRYRQSLVELFLIPFAAIFIIQPRKNLQLIFYNLRRRIAGIAVLCFTAISWSLDIIYLIFRFTN